ncbi:hypothetical protein HZH68_016184 [Vespula germanica]|uniref:Uncharacterized protein n=1 Tax=Vespula germanica TaxID=30212 RepID=A0A834J405_VESGE|nr:hypothetical protein HZH68_016184 [Vespula germanica]
MLVTRKPSIPSPFATDASNERSRQQRQWHGIAIVARVAVMYRAAFLRTILDLLFRPDPFCPSTTTDSLSVSFYPASERYSIPLASKPRCNNCRNSRNDCTNDNT